MRIVVQSMYGVPIENRKSVSALSLTGPPLDLYLYLLQCTYILSLSPSIIILIPSRNGLAAAAREFNLAMLIILMVLKWFVTLHFISGNRQQQPDDLKYVQ